MSNQMYVFLGILGLIALVGWTIRSQRLYSPERRIKWHGLDVSPVASLGPDQIQPVSGSIMFKNTTDQSKWCNVKVENGKIIIKSATGETLQETNCADIRSLDSSIPGVVIANLGDPKFLSTGSSNRFALDFRLSVASWGAMAFRAGPITGSPTLPPKLLAPVFSSQIEADKKALTYYVAISDAMKVT